MLEHPENTGRLGSLIFRQIGNKWQFWSLGEGWTDDDGGPASVGPSDRFGDTVISYESTWAEPCAGDL